MKIKLALVGAILVIIAVLLITEDNEVTPDVELTESYENAVTGISINYPKGYGLDTNYVYAAMGPGKEIAGVRFTIPSSMTTGTNLSTDSYISIESLPNVESCNANQYLDQAPTALSLTEGRAAYSVASKIGAGAGNRYEEKVYALATSKPCVAVRYFIHYGVIENYPAGTVNEFDKQGLTKQFDSIRQTLVIKGK